LDNLINNGYAMFIVAAYDVTSGRQAITSP
jgi:hypothetical protein